MEENKSSPNAVMPQMAKRIDIGYKDGNVSGVSIVFHEEKKQEPPHQTPQRIRSWLQF